MNFPTLLPVVSLISTKGKLKSSLVTSRSSCCFRCKFHVAKQSVAPYKLNNSGSNSLNVLMFFLISNMDNNPNFNLSSSVSILIFCVLAL